MKYWLSLTLLLLTLATGALFQRTISPDRTGAASVASLSETLAQEEQNRMRPDTQPFQGLPGDLGDALSEAFPLLVDLHHDGESGQAFFILAEHQTALRQISKSLSGSPEPYARKLGAYALGFLEDVNSNDFDYVLQSELARERQDEAVESFNAQSTVEDLLFSAVRVISQGRNREAGVVFLERIVTDVVEDRHYWNTSHEAISALMSVDRERFLPLFRKWAQRVETQPPEHPSNPSFRYERKRAQSIRDGDMRSLFDFIDGQELGTDLMIEAEYQLAWNNLVRAAESFRNR